MTTHYHKRTFDEPRIENDENWGNCVFFFETNRDGEVLRQIEIYQNGKILKYSEQNTEDNYGFLADQPIDLKDFREFEILKSEFEDRWKQ